MKRKLILALGLLLASATAMMADDRWAIQDDGSICWQGANLTKHSDHIEMSGKRVSVVLRYGIDNTGAFTCNKSMVWPMLRTVPNNTHASLMKRIAWDLIDNIIVNNQYLSAEKVDKITLKGLLKVESHFPNGLKMERIYFPSTEKPALIQIMTIKNESQKEIKVRMPYLNNIILTDPAKGTKGAYAIRTRVINPQDIVLKPQESFEYTGLISANVEGEKALEADARKELAAREAQINTLDNNLQLHTPSPVIDRMFAFSKIRACESIYETKNGPMHGPGGESYYAAIWANDQAEYVNPLFPFIGYDYGNQSALNSYQMFAKFINDQGKPIPSSIIAEGTDIWNGAGDRGDAAMIAYGAARYILCRADKKEAEQLWPLIKWCLDYCKSKINEGGVVASNSDELEGRFPSGEANLCTSSLYYDALLSSSYLAPMMGEAKLAAQYKKEAAQLRKNINTYFAGPVEGFDTYAYYKGNDILRSWICIPLVMGINEKAKPTLDALFSPRLWTENGMLTQAGDKTFWDRTTLYALRGAFYVGATEQAYEYLERYSRTRLLGDHVPYAIEAWPEGSQRHLSAESGLYCRIITEGLFGIRPTSYNTFLLTPRLPKAWDKMELRHIRAFATDFDIKVERKASKLQVTITSPNKTQTLQLTDGQTKQITL